MTEQAATWPDIKGVKMIFENFTHIVQKIPCIINGLYNFCHATQIFS